MHDFAREFQNTRWKNFLVYIRFVATVPCKNLRHKSNTFHAILALCACLYRTNLLKPVSIKRGKTPESRRFKIYVQNLLHSHALKRVRYCAIVAAMMEWSSSLHSLSRRSFNSSHHGSANNPVFRDTSDTVVQRIQIRRIAWPHLWVWEDELWCFSLYQCANVTCTMWFHWGQHYVTRKGVYVTRNAVNLAVWSVFTCKVVHQKSWRSVHICKSYCEINEWHFFIWTRCRYLAIVTLSVCLYFLMYLHPLPGASKHS